MERDNNRGPPWKRFRGGFRNFSSRRGSKGPHSAGPSRFPRKLSTDNDFVEGLSFSHSSDVASNDEGSVRTTESEASVVSRNAALEAVIQVVIDDQSSSPLPGWKLYFPNEVYSNNSDKVPLFNACKDYLAKFYTQQQTSTLDELKYFFVDAEHFVQHLAEQVPDIRTKLNEQPETVIRCTGLAMHQLLVLLQSDEDENELDMIHARFVNIRQVQFKEIRANLFGKLVSLTGTVVSVGNVKPMCTRMAFECLRCGSTQALLLPDGKYMLPVKCSDKDCKSRSFLPLRQGCGTQTVNWQRIKIQELSTDKSNSNVGSGRIPSIVDCELTNDLVDSCTAGDVVKVCGIVKVSNNSEKSFSKASKDRCLFELYVNANSVLKEKERFGHKLPAMIGSSLPWKDADPYSGLDDSDLNVIDKLRNCRDLFSTLVHSLCPQICGHDVVKAGLLLALFGGETAQQNNSGGKSSSNSVRKTRGTIHVLIVGDPGLGKSRLLHAAAAICPRGIFVCGKSATQAGLTVNIQRDLSSGSESSSLEAGALVLADNGCCCIDEFDKMSAHHHSLLEAMEHQTVSIAKAGFVSTFPARSSVLAAANPVCGHYNKSKTVAENLKINGAILSRFDLVFILLDKAEAYDNNIPDHILASYGRARRAGASCSSNNAFWAGLSGHVSCVINRATQAMHVPLESRLKRAADEGATIPPEILRRFISLAKENVHPLLSDGAAATLQDFYLSLRRKYNTPDGTPVATRQLQSLIRLTKAKARAEYREIATEDDAADVIEIMRDSMRDTYTDTEDKLDFSRSHGGSGMSQKAQIMRLLSGLKKLSVEKGSDLFTREEIKNATVDLCLQLKDFNGVFQSLNSQGFLLNKGGRKFKLQCSDF